MGAQQVNWHEGLFLQPQHLQLMQRQLLDQFGEERRLTWAYPYGVIECELSDIALQNNRIEFDRLHVVMRSGRRVTFPGNADLVPLDITRALEMGAGTLVISLAIPQWQERRPNANAADAEPGVGAQDALYRVYEQPIYDENSGANPQPVQVRRINARLIIDDDGQTDFETIPLIRVKRGAGQAVGKPIRDRTAIPPCMVLDGSADLRRIMLDIAEAVEASRRELVPELTRDGFDYSTIQGAQFGRVLKLRTLNRFASRLSTLAKATGVPPFAAYLEIRELIGELVALEPDKDELFDAPAYSHEDCGLVFTDLQDRVMKLLAKVVKENVLSVPFQEQGHYLVAALNEEHLTRPIDYFLGVETSGNPTALSQTVQHPDNFKLIAALHVTKGFRGVRLVEERHPPTALARREGTYYFRLDRTGRSEDAWKQVLDPRNDKKLAIKWTQADFPDAKFTLYMTIPQGK